MIAGLEDPVCLPHNQTVYTSPIGAQFFIFCEGVFPVTVDDAQFGDLYFTIVPDFLTCVNGCAEWNQNTSLPQCLGISFALGVYGPEGEGKGSWCMYRWNIGEGNFVYTQGWSVARLQTYSNISSTVRKRLIIFADYVRELPLYLHQRCQILEPEQLCLLLRRIKAQQSTLEVSLEDWLAES